MAEKPTYKELEQRIKELEKEAAEHKQAKEVLKETEQKYQHLTESLLDTVYEFDRKGRFTYVNEAGTHMFGYSKQEILNGLRVQTTMVEEVRDLSQRIISEIFKGNTTVGERTFLRKDGTQFIGEIHSGPIYKGEEMVGVRGVLRDITEQKKVEEALRKSEEKYKNLFQSSFDGIAESDLEGNLISCNVAYLEMTDHSEEEIKKLNYQDITPEKWAEVDKKHVEQCLQRGYSDLYEKERIKKDGTIIPISIRIWLRRDAQGNPLCLWAIVRDITEQKQAEMAIKQERDNLQAALAEVKTLSGLLPICANCKKIRDDKGYWNQIEAYIRDHSEADFSHSICPECVKKLYPEFYKGD